MRAPLPDLDALDRQARAAGFTGAYIPPSVDEWSEHGRAISSNQLWGAVFLSVGFCWFMAGVAALVWLAWAIR